MAASHDVTSRLPLSGSSRELDALTGTFNELMASVALAEAQTEAAYTGAIRALAAALDARDPYTAGHSDRVSVLSVAIGRTLSLPADDLEVLRLGALLHDIGKIGVPDDVLRKPGALTDAEFDVIKQHPVLGARILRSVPFLARHIPIVELHHERPDGRGYPTGLRGDDIPLAARIVHVADAYDAMTSARALAGRAPRATRCASCGAAPAPSSTPKSSARWRPRCQASRRTPDMSCWSMSDTLNRGARKDRREHVFSACSACSAVCVYVLLLSTPASAQSVARFSLESVVAADEFAGENASNKPQVVVDVSLALRLGDNWQLYMRPWFRLPRPGTPTAPVPDWDKELYQAGLRYERRGPVATRVDVGYILSPIGLGIYDVRPGLNPTIVPHLSYLHTDAGVRSDRTARVGRIGDVSARRAALAVDRSMGRARGRHQRRADAHLRRGRGHEPAPDAGCRGGRRRDADHRSPSRRLVRARPLRDA